MAKMITHDFYCLNCGKKGINLMRKQGHQHKRNHRKKLYCVYCKCDVNHVEIKDLEEKEDFLYNFELGLYKEEATKSMEVCKGELK